MAITEKQFKKLADGDYVAIGKTRYVVRGKNADKHPQLVNCDTGEEYWMAYYVIHLMYLVGAPEPPKKKEIVDTSDECDVQSPPIEIAEPAKKKRGRPRKTPV